MNLPLSVAPDDITPIGQDFDYNAQLDKLKQKSFPCQVYGNERRHFKLQWLQKYKWIEYSIERDAVFCVTCRHFGNQQSKETTFTVIGFRNWKKANTEKKGFAKHSLSASHIEAVARQIEKKKRLQSGNSITELLNDSKLEKRRYYVKSIIETIVSLASNRLALRGDWDEEEQHENGLFNVLYEIIRSKDPHLPICEKIMPLNATYKSPQIQNEIIDILAGLSAESNTVRTLLQPPLTFGDHRYSKPSRCGEAVFRAHKADIYIVQKAKDKKGVRREIDCTSTRHALDWSRKGYKIRDG